MTQKEIINQVAKEFDIPVGCAELIFKSIWHFVLQTYKGLPIKDSYTDEEVDKLRLAFSLNKFGKIYMPAWRYNKHIKKYKKNLETRQKYKERCLK